MVSGSWSPMKYWKKLSKLTSKPFVFDSVRNAGKALALLSVAALVTTSFILKIPRLFKTGNVDVDVRIKHQSEGRDFFETYYNKPAYNLIKDIDLERLTIPKLIQKISLKGFSTKNISITIILLDKQTHGNYQGNSLRFPASVVKLFWMVAVLDTQSRGEGIELLSLRKSLIDMMSKSDNNSSSFIVDFLTKTTSSKSSSHSEYEQWMEKRMSVSNIFRRIGYKGIYISQKTYPITKPRIPEPEGNDLMMRGDRQNPIRNAISTNQAARLMYDIRNNFILPDEYTSQAMNLLNRSYPERTKLRKQKEVGYFSPIYGFLGQNLNQDIDIFSKAGWTSKTRQEVALIRHRLTQKEIIVAIFAEGKSYAQDENLFPEIATFLVKELKLESR